MFQKHPPHIRKKIALICTGIVTVVLLGVLMAKYLSPRDVKDNLSPSKLRTFYETILNNTQSYVGGN